MVSKPITSCSVTRWGSTPHGMKCSQRTKTVGAVRPLERGLDGSGISLLPITPRIAGLAVELVEHHRDPQDRLIIATALSYDATLISADTRFPLYTELNGRLLT